jgi:type I restriction enzyme S subunit
MAVKKGYKQTEVGTIPEDWTITSVGNEFTIQLGKMLDSEKNIGVPKPFLGNRCVQWGRFDLSDLGTIKLTSSDLKRFRLQDGDLLVCEGGEIGRAAIWRSEIDECYFQKALHRLQPKKSYVVRFMLYILEHLSAIGFLSNYVTQTSIAHLPKDKFETVPVPLPPLAEQNAIAGALSDADAWIESLEQLIAKKRQIKQGAMQELLTGKRRLPGFSGEWETKRLGDQCQFLRNGKNSRAELTVEGSLRYLHYGDIHSCKDVYICPKSLPSLPTTKANTLDRLQDGDLVFADASEDTIGISKSVEIVKTDGVDLVAGLHTIAVRFSGRMFAPRFAGYLQHCPNFSSHLRKLAAGTKVYATNRSHISSAEVCIPPLNEQTAIATILSDMEREIESLEQKLSKAREIKQGMMQELLTGRIRLV